ncbi:hypothetical protein KAI56_02480 [Candidatus Parcubacteria bacterium]|nr:hypothetical protein [Candidatus Parcubacteria bacterium]
MDTKFSRDLIKGRIAEVIFEQMFREAEKYTVIPFGYENLIPELMNCGNSYNTKKVIKNISSSPDFVLISQSKESVFLVEVKYRYKFNKREIKNLAEKQKCRWHPSWMFIATLNGFYFDSCSGIIKNDGEVTALKNGWIRKDLQDKYLELLKEFER